MIGFTVAGESSLGLKSWAEFVVLGLSWHLFTFLLIAELTVAAAVGGTNCWALVILLS